MYINNNKTATNAHKNSISLTYKNIIFFYYRDLIANEQNAKNELFYKDVIRLPLENSIYNFKSADKNNKIKILEKSLISVNNEIQKKKLYNLIRSNVSIKKACSIHENLFLLDRFKFNFFFKNSISLNSYRIFENFFKFQFFAYTYLNSFLKNEFYRTVTKTRVKTRFSFYTKVKIKVDMFSKKLDFNFETPAQKVLENSFVTKSNLFELKKPEKYLSQKHYIYNKPNVLQDTFIQEKMEVFLSFFFVLPYILVKKRKVFLVCRKKMWLFKNKADKKVYANKLYIHNLVEDMSSNSTHILKRFGINDYSALFNNFEKSNVSKSYNYIIQEKFLYNNFMPYYNFFLKSEFIKLVLIRNQQMPKYIQYYNIYLKNFLETFTQRKIWLKVNTNPNYLISHKVQTWIENIYITNKYEYSGFTKHFYLLEFFEILYISFFYRDLKFFSYWFKKIMEKLHLKKHRKFLRILHILMKNHLDFLNLTEVNGFKMDVRGKLSTAGNSKKKHYAFTIGSIGNTSKNHDLSFSQTTIRTTTGVLGVNMSLSY